MTTHVPVGVIFLNIFSSFLFPTFTGEVLVLGVYGGVVGHSHLSLRIEDTDEVFKVSSTVVGIADCRA